MWRDGTPIGEVTIHSRNDRYFYAYRGGCPVQEWGTVTVAASAPASSWLTRR